MAFVTTAVAVVADIYVYNEFIASDSTSNGNGNGNGNGAGAGDNGFAGRRRRR